MKLSVVLAALFLAGVLASLAIAKPPPGHGHDRHGATTATETGDSTDTPSTDTTTTAAGGRVALCHRTGSRTHPWVRIALPAHAAAKRLRRGDVLPVDGRCPAPERHPGGDEPGTTATTT